MPDPRARCPDHGYFAGSRCPVCENTGHRLLTGDQRRRLSKYCSGALRHFPDDAGLTLDSAGWTAFESLVEAVERKYDWADAEALAAVVATDPKGRFERTGGADDRIRAAYGHSVDVDLESGGTAVPETLYHGTAPRNLDAIRNEGLKPMARQLVHLSGTVEMAREVGQRHSANPVILEVDAAGLLAAGYEVTRRGEGVYTVEKVPPEFISEQ